jgi:hypothetical protein
VVQAVPGIKEDPISKITNAKRAGEALSSNPITKKGEKKMHPQAFADKLKKTQGLLGPVVSLSLSLSLSLFD